MRSVYITNEKTQYVVLGDEYSSFAWDRSCLLPSPDGPIHAVHRGKHVVMLHALSVDQRTRTQGTVMVGVICRQDIPDPYFWNEPLTEEWLHEAIIMIDSNMAAKSHANR